MKTTKEQYQQKFKEKFGVDVELFGYVGLYDRCIHHYTYNDEKITISKQPYLVITGEKLPHLTFRLSAEEYEKRLKEKFKNDVKVLNYKGTKVACTHIITINNTTIRINIKPTYLLRRTCLITAKEYETVLKDKLGSKVMVRDYVDMETACLHIFINKQKDGYYKPCEML